MKKYWSLSESPISDEAQIFEYINDVPFVHFTIGSTVYARRIVEALNSAPELLKENEQLKEQVRVLREALDIVVGCMALERVERFDILEKCKEALNQTKI